MKLMSKIGLLVALTLGGNAVAKDDKETGDAKQAPRKIAGNGSFVTADSTNINFEETLIDGKMQAPQGFFLQGRQSQSMTQMVRLRSKFRSELRNSKSAVKSLVK